MFSQTLSINSAMMPDEISSRLGAAIRDAARGERCASLLEQFNVNSLQPALLPPQLLVRGPDGSRDSVCMASDQNLNAGYRSLGHDAFAIFCLRSFHQNSGARDTDLPGLTAVGTPSAWPPSKFRGPPSMVSFSRSRRSTVQRPFLGRKASLLPCSGGLSGRTAKIHQAAGDVGDTAYYLEASSG